MFVKNELKERRMRVDVVLLMKNSASMLGESIFEKRIKSIKCNIPVNNLIVVDAFSSDRTIEIIKSVFPDAIVITSSAKRGKAREIGIKNVSTEVFVFIDSDVVVPPGWFEKGIRYFEDSHIGAVGGVAIPLDPKGFKVFYVAEIVDRIRFSKRSQPHIDGSNVLIRTKSVKDISIPEDLHWVEDTFIEQFIKAKRFKVIVDEKMHVFHVHRHKTLRLSELIKVTELQVKYGLLRSLEYRTMERVVSSILRSMIALTIFDPSIAHEFLKYAVLSLITYIVVKRRLHNSACMRCSDESITR